jgi:hypothetical protein
MAVVVRRMRQRYVKLVNWEYRESFDSSELVSGERESHGHREVCWHGLEEKGGTRNCQGMERAKRLEWDQKYRPERRLQRFEECLSHLRP